MINILIKQKHYFRLLVHTGILLHHAKQIKTNQNRTVKIDKDGLRSFFLNVHKMPLNIQKISKKSLKKNKNTWTVYFYKSPQTYFFYFLTIDRSPVFTYGVFAMLFCYIQYMYMGERFVLLFPLCKKLRKLCSRVTWHKSWS